MTLEGSGDGLTNGCHRGMMQAKFSGPNPSLSFRVVNVKNSRLHDIHNYMGLEHLKITPTIDVLDR